VFYFLTFAGGLRRLVLDKTFVFNLYKIAMQEVFWNQVMFLWKAAKRHRLALSCNVLDVGNRPR